VGSLSAALSSPTLQQTAVALEGFLEELINASDYKGRRLATHFVKLPSRARNAKFYQVCY
jgi:hypothetical protein